MSTTGRPSPTGPGARVEESVIDNVVSRQDVETLLSTRRELGAEYEAPLVEAFAERVERAVAARADEAAAERAGVARSAETARLRQFVLGIVSLAVGVPVTVVPMATAGTDALPAVVVGWLGIAVVNGVHALSVRADRRPVRR